MTPANMAAKRAADMAATHAAAFTQSRPWSAAEFSDLLAQPYCFMVGDPKCFALVRVVVDEAELLTLATHPTRQRQGLARTLMPLWQTKARNRGARQAFLEVAADNTPAITLYAQCGYIQTGKRRAYYRRDDQPAVAALLMTRALP